MRVTKDELKRSFCDYVLTWKRTGRLELCIEIAGAAAFANDVCTLLADIDDLIPDEVAAALDLPAGTSYAQATAPVLKAFAEPIISTPEEEAEEEMFALKASAVFEQLNEQNPDMPPLPVAYPKATRRQQ
jgi:hypothetical protein